MPFDPRRGLLAGRSKKLEQKKTSWLRRPFSVPAFCVPARLFGPVGRSKTVRGEKLRRSNPLAGPISFLQRRGARRFARGIHAAGKNGAGKLGPLKAVHPALHGLLRA